MAPIVQHSGIDFAPLGLTNMLNGGGAIRAMQARPSDNGSSSLTVSMEVRGTGDFLAYSSHPPSAVYGGERGMRSLAFDHNPASRQLHLELPPEGLLDQTVVIHL